MSLKLLTKSVSAANTATQLTTTVTPCCYVVISASPNNKDGVYVGDSTVMSGSTDSGVVISVTDGKVFLSSVSFGAQGAANAINLADIYIASAWTGAKVSVAYIET